ncbi:interleukin-17 receptor D isoform 2 precursor [Silurus meridionalis]|nr:interleukin-17 receptor D isoform 2 precursor [Silurus meridionalis]
MDKSGPVLSSAVFTLLIREGGLRVLQRLETSVVKHSSTRGQPLHVCGMTGVQSGSDESGRKLITYRNDNCSLNWNPWGKHAIHEVNNISFTHLSCDNQAAVVVHWMPSPLGIEHVKGFRVYLEEKNPEGKQCQHMILKDPRQLNFSFKNVKLSSQPFVGLAFEMDYMVRIVPFPTFMNDSFFPPSFLHTNSCEVLLGPDNLVCKPFWKPKMLNVSQLGSSLHVVFDHAPPTFGFNTYNLYYKLRQESHFKLKRCKPEMNGPKTTCILQDVTPGTYAIELRDDNNNTRRQTLYHVSQVHSPWAGPIRAIAITVPLVIMSAFATLFTVMCRKKQQENIYSHLDEESSESSSHTTALSSERPWPRPKVFICYSTKDCPKHLAVIQSFAFFLQDFCGCAVVLDLWEHLEICKEGQMSWLSRHIDEAHFLITICSKGFKYFVEKRHRKGKATSKEKNKEGAIPDLSSNDLFVVAAAMIGEKLHEAQQGSADLSRFMAVYFDYSRESDVPTSFALAPRFKLMDQLPELLARLHSRQLGVPAVSKRNYFRSKAGRSLYVAICNMHQHIAHEPDWFERQLMPPVSAPIPHKREKPDSGLALNEVVLKRHFDNERPIMNVLIPTTMPNPGTFLLSGIASRSAQEEIGESSSQSSSSSGQEASALPRPLCHTDGSASPPEMPRDSGIYDSSVPSSELSIPLMEGLSPDLADSTSLTESVSSSSGLGDEEPPAVSSLHCTTPTICKAELHHLVEPIEGLVAPASP